MATFKIKDLFGEEITLQPRVELYSVTDFMGKKCPVSQLFWTSWAERRRKQNSMQSYRILRGIYQC